MKLQSHPRLYIGQTQRDRLQQTPSSLLLKDAQEHVTKDAVHFATMPALTYPRDVHNELLLRAREMQCRVVTLLTRWEQTHEKKYRTAIFKNIRLMKDWEYWSWPSWRIKQPRSHFDLSFGENSTTLAITYDWLHETLSASEKKLLLDTANKWTIHTARNIVLKNPPSWFGNPDTNWNAVCIGGLGMLALAMSEEIEDADAFVRAADKSLKPFFQQFNDLDGAWPEGVGYWNYGMRYGLMYLLSNEAATGKKHPLLQLPGVKKTMEFPLDFTPNGNVCSFGDVNNWTPLPIHHAAALRLGKKLAAAQVDKATNQKIQHHGPWPHAAEWLLLHDRKTFGKAADAKPTNKTHLKHYKGQDWGIVADQWPKPNLYLSVRGGTTQVGHWHLDLLSFHLVLGDEHLIKSVGPAGYIDTTFSPRRPELPEISYVMKNTILVNGVGVPHGSAVSKMKKISRPGIAGFYLDASEAMNANRGPANAVEYCGRLILMLDRKYVVIVDRAALGHVGLIETRLNSEADIALHSKKPTAVIAGEKKKLRATFASDQTCTANTAQPPMTQITGPQNHMLRYATNQQAIDSTLVTLLSPGSSSAKASIKKVGSRYEVKLSQGKWSRTLKLTKQLGLAAK